MAKVVVIGLHTAGFSTVKALKKRFRQTLEIIVVEKQKGFSYLTQDIYHNIAAPRAVVDPDTAEKCFFSVDQFFGSEREGKVVHGTVVSLTNTQVTLSDKSVISFDYLVIASGAMYDIPWKQNSSKTDGLEILKDLSLKIKSSTDVVIIGGGATGVETAAEIKSIYSEKNVTIIQSEKLLSKVDCDDKHRMRLQKKLQNMNVKVGYGRVENLPKDVITAGPHEIKTSTGESIVSNLTLLTLGKIQPNSTFVDESLLTAEKFVKVKATLQVEKFPNIFSLGDVAHTGASKSVIYIDKQAEIIAHNISVLIGGSGKMKNYIPTAPKLAFYSLGKNDGFAVLPWMPGFISDFMAKTFKSGDLFIAKDSCEYNLKK